MGAEQLPERIAALVDHLRERRDEEIALADVASVTEVLIATMQAYFRRIDTSIYRECRAMSDYIINARREIASLQPKDLDTARIPRAGMELDAIVQQTEEATNTIMESAEAIMAADPAETDAFQNTVQEHIVRIFEACSFQDLTGQRISKVVETLRYVEDRILTLRKLLGVSDEDIQRAIDEEEKLEGEKSLLRGPALAGEGIDQSEVDALMGEEDIPDGAQAPAQGGATTDEESAETAAAPAADAGEVGGAPAAEETPPSADARRAEDAGKMSPGTPQSATTADQDDIDALFD
ncbi:MAG: chemotaxis protein [Alphaproteobacteria bacterium]|nr:MAG: chemotaxis protein [Alphaproteobacteria bacterium]